MVSEEISVSRICEITWRKGRMGYNLSHAHNRTKRRFDINLQNNTFFSKLGICVRLRVTPKALRIVEKSGGIDQFVLAQKERILHPKLRVLRKQLLKKENG